MAAVLTDRSLAGQLVSRGRERLAHFDPDVARAAFVEHLLSVV
jgi:hypothetical protein